MHPIRCSSFELFHSVCQRQIRTQLARKSSYPSSIMGVIRPIQRPLQCGNTLQSWNNLVISRYATNSSFNWSKARKVKPPQATPTKEEKTWKKYLSKFFLKVHPDFFAEYPEIQRTNEDSLQLLNALLDVIQSTHEDRKSRGEFGHVITLRFYILRKEPKMSEKKESDQLFQEIKSTITDPILLTSEQVLSKLQGKIESALCHLLEQANIELPPWVKETQTNKYSFLRARDKKIPEFMEQLKEAICYSNKDSDWLEREATGRTKASTYPDRLGKPMNRQLLFFDGALSIKQREAIYEKIRTNKHKIDDLVGYRWEDIPMLFRSNLPDYWFQMDAIQTELDAEKGGLMLIRVDFTMRQLIDYIKKNILPLRMARDKLQVSIKQMQKLRDQLQHNLENVSDVDMNREILPGQCVVALNKLLDFNVLPKLQKFEWKYVTLIVGKENSKHGNTVTLRHDFTDLEEINKFLSKSLPKIKKMQTETNI